MSEITSRQRLELLNNIRQEHNQNRQTIRSRENLIYGTKGNADAGYSVDTYSSTYLSDIAKTDAFIENPSPLSFGIRMLIAALLLVGYFFLESSKIDLGFLDAEVIRTEVNRYSGVEINLFDFMDNITYTFNND